MKKKNRPTMTAANGYPAHVDEAGRVTGKPAAKHTPGPWRLAEIRSQSITIETVATHHVNSMDAMSGRDLSGQRAELIARVMTGGNSMPDIALKNAALIAAAPDLLEVLYKALPIVEDAKEDPTYKPGYTSSIERIIRAAIAKAEGAR